jgi:hypothetical protein
MSVTHRAILAAAVALAASLPLAPAAVAGYGAIAWDKGTGKWGAGWNQPSPKRAEEVAVGECGASGCKVVTRVGPFRCGALAATADGKHIGAAGRKDREAARAAALKNCQADSAGACTIRNSDCNK